jgi:hypothetical protein
VTCFVSVKFGAHKWTLPLHSTTLPGGRSQTQHFARLFMEGHVCTSMHAFRPYLTLKPGILTSSMGNAKSASLTHVFLHNKLTSRAALQKAWKKDATRR